MKLPKQTAPVQRNICTTTMSSGNGVNGVEASDTIDDIVKVTQGLTPLLTSLGTAAIGGLI